MKVKSFSRVRLLATPWTAAYQAPLSMSVTLIFFHGFTGKVCQWFKGSGEILKDLIIRMRRITEMVIEELRSLRMKLK